jgi:putative nucleotidyltransferase with HDIG domain
MYIYKIIVKYFTIFNIRCNFVRKKMKFSINETILNTIAQVANINGLESYIVGGYVRDQLINRKSKDIDILVVGDGITLAQQVAKVLNINNVVIFKNFGTAQINHNACNIEFVGARKESYQHHSRKPKVEQGTLYDDIYRRDFTINAMAVSLNNNNYCEIIDFFNGIADLEKKIIRTPAPPEITFSDDPLRMLRAIRFAAQLQFEICDETYHGIKINAERINIISKERIVDELNKILLSKKPSIGFELLENTGLLSYIIPELVNLKGVDNVEGMMHKDNFEHTMQVVDQLRENTDNIWLLWAGLLHDIGKPSTKKLVKNTGWTFHGHEVVGAHITEKIFHRLKLPLHEPLLYVKKLVNLHLRPIALVSEHVSDSGIRRLIFDAGNDLEDLMLLAEADITSKNERKIKQYLKNFKLVRQKIVELEEKDRVRNFQPPITGEEIMIWFNIPPCKLVGDLKIKIKDAILDGVIPNERNEAIRYLLLIAKENGLTLDKNIIPE